MVESGIFYATFVDPLLTGLRKRILPEIKQGETVIDIACGTGAQVFALANRASQVTGVDLSQSMVDFANRRLRKTGLKNVTFHTADATRLEQFGDKSFDVAAMTLALHQFNPDLYQPILAEMKRIAKRIVIVDYAVPLPNNYAGIGSRIAEFMAGGEHNHNFKLYYKTGGLNSILPSHGVKIQKSVLIAKRAFQLAVCSTF
ncbi:MAG: class I SAM-dependent methyltransferase [Draconibacterium sp.]